MRSLLPEPADELTDDDLATLYAYPAGGPWLRANMVSSVDGAASGPDGRSGTLGTAGDRRVFSLLRRLADVVLVGGGTARTERYGSPDEGTALAVVSARLDLGEALLAGGDRVVVVTRDDAPADRLAQVRELVDVVTTGPGPVDLAAGLAALRSRGWDRVLCEGGPSLLGAAWSAGIVDELCLTVSPQVLAGAAPRVVTGAALDPPVGLVLAGLLEEDGALFTRWLRRPARPGR